MSHTFSGFNVVDGHFCPVQDDILALPALTSLPISANRERPYLPQRMSLLKRDQLALEYSILGDHRYEGEDRHVIIIVMTVVRMRLQFSL